MLHWRLWEEVGHPLPSTVDSPEIVNSPEAPVARSDRVPVGVTGLPRTHREDDAAGEVCPEGPAESLTAVTETGTMELEVATDSMTVEVPSAALTRLEAPPTVTV